MKRHDAALPREPRQQRRVVAVADERLRRAGGSRPDRAAAAAGRCRSRRERRSRAAIDGSLHARRNARGAHRGVARGIALAREHRRRRRPVRSRAAAAPRRRRRTTRGRTGWRARRRRCGRPAAARAASACGYDEPRHLGGDGLVLVAAENGAQGRAGGGPRPRRREEALLDAAVPRQRVLDALQRQRPFSTA